MNTLEKIKIKNIKVYAYHGCMKEEAIIGTTYLVNLTVYANLKKAGETDDLKDTINYAKLADLVKDQMEIRSNLLENVAHRILIEIGTCFSSIKKAKIKITKTNPPISVDTEGTSVVFKKVF